MYVVVLKAEQLQLSQRFEFADMSEIQEGDREKGSVVRRRLGWIYRAVDA
jgi:hypothetical protein